MPDEKPVRKSTEDNAPPVNPEKRKETPADPRPAKPSGARGAAARETAAAGPKHPTGTKASSGDEPVSGGDEPASGGDEPVSGGGEPERPAPSDTGPATEKPPVIAPPPPTSFYVVEVDNRTGIAIRIEHFNEKTGERKELTDQEYALIYPYGRPGRRRPAAEVRPTAAASGTGAPPASKPLSASKRRSTNTGARSMFPADNMQLVEAYYRGVTDYMRALTSIR